jgi:glycerophosphoryl diester phosphodiesterase
LGGSGGGGGGGGGGPTFNTIFREPSPADIMIAADRTAKSIATLSKAPRVQLVSAEGGPADLPGVRYADMVTVEGLKAIAGYAQAVGPEWRQVIAINPAGALAGPTPLVANAHAAGLKVIPWTVRAENVFLPPALRRGTEPGAHGDVATLLKALFATGVDGLFSDFPDLAVAARGI